MMPERVLAAAFTGDFYPVLRLYVVTAITAKLTVQFGAVIILMLWLYAEAPWILSGRPTGV